MKLDHKLFAALGWHATGDLGPWTFYTSKRGRLVFFLRAPPTKPPTPRQTFLRWKLSMIAKLWSALTADEKALWELVTKRLSLGLTGYNLFQSYHWTLDRTAVATLERQSGISLPGLPA